MFQAESKSGRMIVTIQGHGVRWRDQWTWSSNLVKGEPEMQKLHEVGAGVGKFFNEWQADPFPPLPPEKGNISSKKEISYRKRKSHKKT